jgi:4-hydroxybenzoate polyprenyltransferase
MPAVLRRDPRVLRLEGLWWMMRPPSVATAFIAVPGWLASESATAYGRLAAMVAAVMVGRAIANVVNDILDEEKDRVTAPELPLPSGIVTRTQARVLTLLLGTCLVILLGLASTDWTGFALGLAGSIACGACVGLYSLVKPYAFLAVPVTGGAYLSVPVTAWMVGGGGWSPETAVVFFYGLLRGLAANVFSTYRDVDRDVEVGNYSVAVRLGARRALALGIALETTAVLSIVAIAALRGDLWLGLVVVAVSLALLAVAFRDARAQRQSTKPEDERSLLDLPLRIARNHVAVVLVQSVPVGIVLAAISAASIRSESLYARRLIAGELREELREAQRRLQAYPISPSRAKSSLPR